MSHTNFHPSLQQTWKFLHSIPQISGILETLSATHAILEAQVDAILKNPCEHSYADEVEEAASCYFVIKKIVSDSNGENIVTDLGFELTRSGKLADHVEAFRERYAEPLYDYIDEQLDDTGAILSLLIKYKHKCEWFQREKLFRIWNEDTQKGESRLALHLYEFLHDHDINFSIEPTCADGKADLIAEQVGDERLIADAKIFNPDKSKAKSYILQAARQAYIYTQNYNESVGYLAIFKTSESDLRLSLSGCAQSVPYIIINNKTIFLVVIDIFPHTESASKRKQDKYTEITISDLIPDTTAEASNLEVA